MAKIKAPLFSLDAVGTLDNTITYKKNSQNNIAQKYSQPGSKTPFESSPRQKDQRSIIGLITIHWQCMSSIDKLTWEASAKAIRFKGTGYHYFLHLAQTNLLQYLGLVGYWSMNYNIGNKIPDLSGNGNHGILSPTYPGDCPTLVDSFDKKQGKASKFDGINNYISINNFGLKAPTHEISIEFCAKTFSPLAAGKDLISLVPFKDTERIVIHYPFEGYLYWQFGNPPYAAISYLLPAVVIGTWQHFVCVHSYSKNFMGIYHNGELVVSAAKRDIYDHYNANLQIGGRENYKFNGLIDEVHIYNRALDPKEILKHYQSYNL